ncbi:MAG: macro domain-containing protein [Gemmatimonadota bacterium]
MIQAVVDDLAFLEAEAVLRPADASLHPVTAAAVRLDRQAGAAFAAQRRVSTPLEAGAAVVTGAGDLAADYVLHVIIQDPETLTTRETVRRALVSAWERCAEWGIRSVASTPVGAGAGLLDVEEATELMAATFPAAADCPASLTIVLERDEDRVMVEAVLRRRSA